jgi:hypothetical protein
VVQHISALVIVPAGTSGLPYLHLYDFNNTPLGHWYFLGKLASTTASYQYNVVDEDTLAYFDSNTGPGIDTFGNTSVAEGAQITVTGYLENCLVTGCPAIVH